MSTAAIVVLTVILTLAAAGIGFIVLKARKSGDTTIPWDKIRPVLTEVFTEAIKLREADAMGYGALENYVVNFVKEKVDEATFLTADEKALLSVELIRGLIKPRLEELYNKKG